MPVIVISGARQLQGPLGIGTTPVAGASLKAAAPILIADGSNAAPSLAFGSDTDTGLAWGGSNLLGLVSGGQYLAGPTSETHFQFRSTGFIGWSSTTWAGAGSDLQLARDAAGVLSVRGQSAILPGSVRVYGANGSYWEYGSASEELTLANAASTLTTANLLPADSIIEAVTVRVTTVIPTAATFSVGVTGTAARFGSGIAVAADTTAVCLAHSDQTGAGGPKQLAAAKVLITPNLTPAAATGKVRINVFYRRFVAPTT